MKAERFLKKYEFSGGAQDLDSSYFMQVARFLKKYDFSGHVWPEMEFGWKIVVGTMIGCFGSAFGSVGGVGGGGIFIPMLMLIIGFDAKSSAALSKCMITGAAVSTVYHNMKLKHPTLDIPIFKYDLLLLILPYLLLGISIGVTFSVIFPDWAITALLIILFFGTAVKAFLKGIDTWKQETILKEAAAKLLHPTEVDYKPLLGGPSNNSEKSAKGKQVNVLENIRWIELGAVVFVWIGYLILQIAKNYTATTRKRRRPAFWVLNVLQIPVSISVSLYQAIGLYKGTRRVRSMGEAMNWSVRKLAAFCICGMVAGTIGGLLGIGGGFVMGPLFIEIGIHPLVSSATATLGMTFSASLSVVEYYLLDRFPIPYVDADDRIQQHGTEDLDSTSSYYLMKAARFLKKYEFSGHVWPEMEFGWKIVVGSMIGCFGAAFGSVGGVGGGGIFIPMLMLIIGFDAKSSAALSKCMISGAAVSTVYHNMRLKHPMLDIPIFEYDLILLILPYQLLGISLGVTFSVIFPDWAITALLIILFFGTSVKAFLKGIDTWKQETVLKEAAAKLLHPTSEPLLGGPSDNSEKSAKGKQVNVLENIRWMELGAVVFVWIGYVILQIAKNYTATCSTAFWVLNLLQIPVSASVSLYQAIGLYRGTRKVRSMGEAMTWSVRKLAAFCICGMVAGTIGGLLGIGGGFVMGPLFIEIGIHPLVSSATATLGMTFSASLSVVEYYLLDRFPIPYALYFIGVSIVAAFFGQYVITKMIKITGRASLIIFVLSFTIFVSGISLGGVGISNMIGKIERGEYMGFEDLCNNT